MPPLLADYFLNIFKQERGLPHLRVSEKTLEKMLEYEWPGNVRELRNALKRAVVMGNGQEILPEDLPISAPKKTHPAMEVGLTLKEAVDSFKKEFITLNLKDSGGNRSKAAKIMGIQRAYLSRLISKYRLQEIQSFGSPLYGFPFLTTLSTFRAATDSLIPFLGTRRWGNGGISLSLNITNVTFCIHYGRGAKVNLQKYSIKT